MDNELFERIKLEMKSKGISYRELSSLTGVPRSTINDNLNGRAKMSAESLAKIADALNVTVEYLRFGYEPTTHKFTEHEPTDTQLIEINHQLNSDGQAKLLDYAMDLVENGKYRKE